jgi:hypothetical protein
VAERGITALVNPERLRRILSRMLDEDEFLSPHGIRSLSKFYMYYGDAFKVECPTGSGRMMNLFEVSKEISYRLIGIFLRDERGRRPVYGGTKKFQSDPHWRDHVLLRPRARQGRRVRAGRAQMRFGAEKCR